ncbi:MAG TPA: isocitrate/isopropylmalate family dehydrogenase [Candidatus Methanomethylophilaceae archaeon]|nr:isocitrate/isopropylmalate family dehydrogenase [Candidatus Methanomethylophilaceae archaeon]
MSKTVLVLPGDGVGKEVTDAAVAVLRSVSDVNIEFADIGDAAYDKTGYHLPPETMEAAAEADAIIATPVRRRATERKYKDPLGILRKQLEMYTLMRSFKPPGDDIGVQGLDCLLFSCNPQSTGVSNEMETLKGVTVESFLDVIVCRKVILTAGKISAEKHRKKIVCLRDLELNRYMDSIFTDLFYEELAASEFDISDMEVAEAVSDLVIDPTSTDVMLVPVSYSNAVSGVLMGLCGGAYLTSTGYIGDNTAMFMPMHGPVEWLTGKDTVNPTGCILAAAMTLDGLDMSVEGDKIRNAVRSAYGKGMKTRDVGGELSTSEFVYRVSKLSERSD